MTYEYEKELKKECIEFLKLLPRAMFKDTPNSGVVFRGKIRSKSRDPGKPDITGCLRGKFVALETKLRKGKQSEDQRKYQDELEEAEGYYFVIRKMKDLSDAIVEVTGERLDDILLQVLRV